MHILLVLVQGNLLKVLFAAKVARIDPDRAAHLRAYFACAGSGQPAQSILCHKSCRDSLHLHEMTKYDYTGYVRH